MEVRAATKYIRQSPRKIRLVADLIRGLDVEKAETVLTFTQKRSSHAVKDLLHSAVANAEHNHNLDKKNLFVKEIFVNPGPSLKRFMPRAQGRAFQILKRTSHIVVVLDERVKSKPKKKTEKKEVVKKTDRKEAGEKAQKAQVTPKANPKSSTSAKAKKSKLVKEKE